jgi:hypothetical protein
MRKKRQQEKQMQKEIIKHVEAKKRREEKTFKKRVSGLIESLQETDSRALLQLRRIIDLLGLDYALQKLNEAEKVEVEGGLMLSSGTRRRTKGGVFFFLVKQHLREEGRKADMKEIFYKNQYPENDQEKGRETVAHKTSVAA